MNNRLLLGAGFVIATFFISQGTSEFISSTTNAKRALTTREKRHCHHVKEEIAELLADIIQQGHQIIEMRGKIGYTLGKSLKQLATDDKKSSFGNASRQELLERAEKLKKIYETNNKELAQLSKDLTYVHSFCSAQ